MRMRTGIGNRFVCTFAATLAVVAAAVQPVSASTPGVSADVLSERANQALHLKESQVISLAVDPRPERVIVGVLPLDDVGYVLHLEPFSVRSDDYRLLVQEDDGLLRDVTPGPIRTVRGSLLGIEGSLVAGSLLEDGLHARIVVDDNNEYWLEPIHGLVEGAGVGSYVVYRTEHAESDGGTCASDALRQPPIQQTRVAQGGDGAIAGGGLCVAELGCDADFEYFQAWGSVGAVEARINSVINTMNIQYERDVDITHTIAAIIVRTTANDPYNGAGASKLLNSLRDEWETNQTGIQRDMAQLFTGRNIGGSTIGIAWVGSVCTSFGYSVVQSDFSANFACTTDLSAHELGHNWGAGHCNCTNHTMNSFITCNNQFHPTATIPEIVTHRDSRTCLDGCGAVDDCGNGVCDPGEDPCNCPQDCGNPPATETDCSDGIDNDCDGLVDCEDPDCSGDPGCAVGGDSAIVECITYTTRGGPNGNKHLDITVNIVDDNGSPVNGATVNLTLTGAGTFNFGGTTDASGNVTFSLINASDSCYTGDVTNVNAAGLSFDGAEPSNGFLKGTDATPDEDCRAGNDLCGQ